jgi:hypothetical protein
LRCFVVPAHFKSQSGNTFTAADALGKSHNAFAQLLAAKGLAQINFIEQGKAAVKLQAEAERKRKVSGKRGPTKDQVNLPQFRGLHQAFNPAAGGSFVKTHVLLPIKFAHHLQQRREILFREKLEKNVHGIARYRV